MRPHIRASLFVLLIATVARGATLYVSPTGDDHNPGTEARPFATLARARDEIRLHSDERPITVVIHGGTYRQTASLQLDALDSDTHWQTAPGQQVRIEGGVRISAKAFGPVKDPQILKRLPAPARANVLVADLASAGIESVQRWPIQFRGAPEAPELFFNDKRMQVARWPNQGWASIKHVINSGADPRDGDKSGRLPTFTIADPRPRSWNADAGVWLFGEFTYNWYDEVIRVKSINQDNGAITLAAPALYSVLSGRFYALNCLAELDEPGEYYIDTQNRRLYFWPPESIQNARIVVSALDAPLLSIDKAHDVTFSGMTFEDALSDAIHVKNGIRVRIKDCTVRDVREQAIRIEGGSDDAVDSCEIYDTGTGGIYLEGGDRRTLTPGHQLAINNRIHDFSRLQRTGACAVTLVGVGNRAAHNLIYNAPHMAVSIIGNDNILEYNIIRNVVNDAEDAGAVYKGRNPSCRGNLIRYNFFRDIGNPHGHTSAIFFDDGDGGDSVIGNVFLHCGGIAPCGAVYSNGGFDIRAENNIFIDCTRGLGSGPWSDARWKAALHGAEGFNWPTKLLKDVDITSEVYLRHYPELAGFMNPKPGEPRVSHARDNVLVRCEGAATGNWKYDPKTMWSTSSDPGFVDAAHGDYRLRPDAEVFKHLPDFKPIPFDQIGPQSQGDRRQAETGIGQ